MKGTLIIKEILACGRGRALYRKIGTSKMGARAFPGMSVLTQTRRNGLFLGFLFRGNEATLPP